MEARQADIVFQRKRELVLENPKLGLPLEVCRDCGMDTLGVSGNGDLKGPGVPVLLGAPPVRFRLTCLVCGADLQPVGPDDVLGWTDQIASILAFKDLEGRGVYARDRG